MKTHKLLFSTLIAASAMTASAYAEEISPSIAWNIVENAYKWVGAVGDGNVETGGNWVAGTFSDGSFTWSETSASGKPSRAERHGPLLYFDTSAGTTGAPENTSDGGGVWVTNNSTVTVSMGSWAGSIQVDDGSTANISWSAQLKDGNIVANGVVNLTTSSINLDTSTTREWYTGVNGEINSIATSLTAWWEFSGAIKALGSGVVNFNNLETIKDGFSIEAAGSSTIGFNGKTVSGGSIILSTGTIQNLTIGNGTTLGLDYVAASGAGTLSNVTIAEGAKLDVSGVVSGYSYKLFSADNFSGASNFSVTNITIDGKEINHRSIASLSNLGEFYYQEGATYSDMIWTGDENAVWNRTAKNWSSATEGSGESIAFENGDSVKFIGSEATVSLEDGSSLIVGNMTVESGAYTLALLDNWASAKITGKTLNVVSGGELKVGTFNLRKIDLEFEWVNVSGSLTYNNGADSWSSLTMNTGSSLYIEDTTGDGFSVKTMQIDGATTITSGWDKIFTVDTLSGNGELSMTGASLGGAFSMNLSDISGYSGAATFNNGNTGLIVNFTGNTSVNSAAKLVFNSGVTINNTGTLTLDGEIALSGSINNTGTVSVSEDVKFDIGQMTAADGVYTFVSGGTIADSWTSLDESNFVQNGYGLARGSFSSAEKGKITYTAGDSKTLTWDVNGRVWDYAASLSWNDSERFFTGDSVIFGTDKANVSIVGNLRANGITVSEDTAFSDNGNEFSVSATSLAIDSGKTLSISGGILLLTGENGSDFQGTLSIGVGGTVKAVGHDTFGWGSSTDITLLGSEVALARLVIADGRNLTMKKNLVLKGNAEVASENGGYFNMYETGGVSASGKNNVISSDFQLRKDDLLVTVEESGELLISGKITHQADWGTYAFKKLGEGVLTLKGDNDFPNLLSLEKGVLVAGHVKALGTGTVSVKKDAVLKIAVSAVDAGTVNLAEGAKFAIDVTGMTPIGTMANSVESVTFEILSDTVLNFNNVEATSETVAAYFSLDSSNLGEWANWSREWNYQNGNLSLTLAIPEPSLFGLLAGLGALALVGTRRRKKA